MMRVQVLSDIHLEFGKFRDTAVERDLTVMAGDIGEGGRAWNTIQEFQKRAPVVYTPGNHEYYDRHIQTVDEEWRERMGPFFLQMSTVEVGGLKVAGCTLWTEFKSPLERMAASQAMTDFKCISFTEDSEWKEHVRWTPYMSAKLHEKMRDWLFAQNADIVVTHHAPSYRSTDPKYRGYLAEAYYSDLDQLILASNIKLWVHGHVHKSNDYMIGNTRVISNPRGYVGHEVNPHFNPSLVVEV